MFGLRPDIDVTNVRSLRPNSAPKTYKFAERLKDRFYVSGLSGGLRKHYSKQNLMLYTAVPGGSSSGGKENRATGVINNVASKRLVYDELLRQRRQEMEIQREQEQLWKLEQQLQEIRRKKELRQQRDASRMLRRMQHIQLKACVLIQRTWRRYYKLKTERDSAQLILSFLQTVRNRQVVYIASLSAGAIRRFASSAGERWKAAQRRREQLSSEAAEIAADALQRELLEGCVEEQVDALVAALEEMQEEDEEEEGGLGGSYHQFFLTEFEGTGAAVEPAFLGAAAAVALVEPSKGAFAALGETGEASVADAQGGSSCSGALPTEDDGGRVARIAFLHQQKLQAMEAEREKRLKVVASSKKVKALEVQQQTQQKLLNDEQKELDRRAFFERLEAMQQQTAQRAASIRARKERIAAERQRQAEQRAAELQAAAEELARARRENNERRKVELHLMRQEDIRPLPASVALPRAVSAPASLGDKEGSGNALPSPPRSAGADNTQLVQATAATGADKDDAIACARAKARRRMQERLRLDREQREREEAAEHTRRDMQARVMEQAYAILQSARKKKKAKRKQRKAAPRKAASIFAESDGNAHDDEELNELLEQAEQQQQLFCDSASLDEESLASAAPQLKPPTPSSLRQLAAADPAPTARPPHRMPRKLRVAPCQKRKKSAETSGRRRAGAPHRDRDDRESLEEELDARARLGKVASLLAMVSRARRKVGADSYRAAEGDVQPCAQLDFSGLEEPSALLCYQFGEEEGCDREGGPEEDGPDEEALDAECALLRQSLMAKMQAFALQPAPVPLASSSSRSLQELFDLSQYAAGALNPSSSFDDDVLMATGDGPDDCSFEMMEMLAQIYNDEN